VNISSANGVAVVAGIGAYTDAKHGAVGSARSTALEYVERDVRVNAVGPGYADTPRMKSMPQGARATIASSYSIGSWPNARR
jgi:NAD(P)-dependent dehydrogenase (short-subunit alcohol dehydrogenase family)